MDKKDNSRSSSCAIVVPEGGIIALFVKKSPSILEFGVCKLDHKQKIKEFIANNIIAHGDNVAVDYETNLLKSGLIDSMSLMTLVNFIESEFDMEVPFTDFTITNFNSVNAMTEYIKNKKAS